MEQIPEFFEKLFGTESWPPRWLCGRWTEFHGWLYIVSDLAVWAAYFTIPLLIFYFIKRKPDAPFPRIFWLFGAFILLCGATHLLDAAAFWWPAYRFNALMRFFTSVTSWATVIALARVLPQALALRSSHELEQEINERKKAEGKLAALNKELEMMVEKRTAEVIQNEKRFRALIENSNEVIIISDPEGKRLFVSEGIKRILGYTTEEYMKLNILDMVPAEEIHAVHQILQKAVDHPRQPFTIRIRIRHQDGSWRWIEAVVSGFLDVPGLNGIVSNYRDVTDRKKAEEKVHKLNEELEQKVIERTAELDSNMQQLKESEEKFQKAFQASAAGISITRLSDSKYLNVNDTFVQMTEYTKEELIDHTSAELGIIVNYNKREEALQQIRELGFIKNYEIQIRNKSGKIVDVLFSTETIVLSEEKYALNIIFDITDRRRAEGQLKKSNELLSNLFEYNPASIVISRLSDAQIINVNEAFLSSFGFTDKEEVLGKTARELNIVAHPEQREELTQLLKKNKVVKDFEIKTYTKQGEVFWISTSILIIEIENAPCLFSISIDISNRKRIEERLEAANKELEAFTYSVSHDLRAPLRAIDGYAKMLEEDYTEIFDEEGKRMLKVVQNNANKMGHLIDDLLEFSKLGRKEIQKTFVDMKELAGEVLNELNRSMRHHAEIKIQELAPVQADYALLHQVLINLISNGIKYSSKNADPVVEISSKKKNGEVIYSVKDNGVGFDMKYAHKLFGVFQRLHKTEEFEGTGVGLAIVQRIISRHGGKVWAEAIPDKGATFYFSLPAN